MCIPAFPRRSPYWPGVIQCGKRQGLGAAVRSFRKQTGLSQETLAHIENIERTHFNSIERGTNRPSLWLILKIARALGVSSADLMMATKGALADATPNEGD